MSDLNPFREEIERPCSSTRPAGQEATSALGLEVVAFWQLGFETPGLNSGDETRLRR
jgi:hypothetical protein